MVEPFVDRNCGACGRLFLPALHHRFKRRIRGVIYYYCCYTCYLKGEQKVGYKTKVGRKPKAVNQYTLDGELIHTFPSLNQAASACGISEPTLSQCCRKPPHKSKGFIFKYAEEGVKNERTDETDTERENT